MRSARIRGGTLPLWSRPSSRSTCSRTWARTRTSRWSGSRATRGTSRTAGARREVRQLLHRVLKVEGAAVVQEQRGLGRYQDDATQARRRRGCFVPGDFLSTRFGFLNVRTFLRCLFNHRRVGVVSSHHEAILSVSLSLIRFPVVTRGTASFVAAPRFLFVVLRDPSFSASGARSMRRGFGRRTRTGAEREHATPAARSAATAAAARGAIARGTRGAPRTGSRFGAAKPRGDVAEARFTRRLELRLVFRFSFHDRGGLGLVRGSVVRNRGRLGGHLDGARRVEREPLSERPRHPPGGGRDQPRRAFPSSSSERVSRAGAAVRPSRAGRVFLSCLRESVVSCFGSAAAARPRGGASRQARGARVSRRSRIRAGKSRTLRRTRKSWFPPARGVFFCLRFGKNQPLPACGCDPACAHFLRGRHTPREKTGENLTQPHFLPSPAQGCIARSPVPPREAPELLGRGQRTARFACMADVCRTRGGALSPLSPNESRKRSRGSTGAQSSWFKRHRTGHSFARRLLHLRGFALDVRQAEELVRFIDQFPPEMDKVRPAPRSRPHRARDPLGHKKRERRHRQTVRIAAISGCFFSFRQTSFVARAPTSPRVFSFPDTLSPLPSKPRRTSRTFWKNAATSTTPSASSRRCV